MIADVLIHEWAEAVAFIRNPATELDDVVDFYREARSRQEETTGIYWRHVNQAIADRWNVTTLRQVKERAA